jgi:hypothetical protein
MGGDGEDPLVVQADVDLRPRFEVGIGGRESGWQACERYAGALEKHLGGWRILRRNCGVHAAGSASFT